MYLFSIYRALTGTKTNATALIMQLPVKGFTGVKDYTDLALAEIPASAG